MYRLDFRLQVLCGEATPAVCSRLFVCCSFSLSGCTAPVRRPKTQLCWWGPDRVSLLLFTSGGRSSMASAIPIYRCDISQSEPTMGSSRYLMLRAILQPEKLN